jgi:hypothetical protein
VHWLGAVDEANSAGVYRSRLDGTFVTERFLDMDRWGGIRSDGEYVFWGGMGGVRRGLIGAPEDAFEMVLPMTLVAAVEIVGEWIVGYDVEGTVGDQDVYAARKDGSERQLLFAGDLHPHFATQGDDVYVRTFHDGVEDVHRLTLSDGADVVVLTAPLRGDFAIVDGWLYAYDVDAGIIRLPVPTL